MINKKIFLPILASILFMTSMNSVFAVEFSDLPADAKKLAKIVVGTSCVVGGTAYLGNHLHVVNEWAFKPIVNAITEVAKKHPWIGDAAKFSVPPLAIYIGYKILKNR